MRQALIPSAMVVLVACAGLEVSPDELRGTSGPVAWEVVEVRQKVTPDQRDIEWNYTLVLRETTGVAIQFEKLEVGAGRLVREETFGWRLESRSELRVPRYYGVSFTPAGVPSFGHPLPVGSQGVTLFYRFRGKDDRGRSVTVDVRFRLDPSVGKRVE